jgi:hypothetical protein
MHGDGDSVDDNNSYSAYVVVVTTNRKMLNVLGTRSSEQQVLVV